MARSMMLAPLYDYAVNIPEWSLVDLPINLESFTCLRRVRSLFPLLSCVESFDWRGFARWELVLQKGRFKSVSATLDLKSPMIRRCLGGCISSCTSISRIFAIFLDVHCAIYKVVVGISFY